MDTTRIGKILLLMSQGPNAQVGCIPCNDLDKLLIKKYPFAYCINDQPYPETGNHWVAMYIHSRGSSLEFFCSFGKPISRYLPHFQNFANRNKLKIVQSNICLQSMLSDVCGQYVIYYIYNRLRRCSRNTFYAKFSSNVKRNDELVRAFVNKYKAQYYNFLK